MEEFALGFATAVDAVEPETNLLVGSRKPFTIGSFRDEAVGRVRAVARYVFKGAADPAFSTGGGATVGRTTANV